MSKKIKIPDEVLEFAFLKYKKYKKKSKKNSLVLSNKEMKESFYSMLLTYLPEVIDWTVFYSHIDEPNVKETKDGIFAKLNDADFIKVISSEIKHGNKIKNIKLLPIILKDMLDKIAAVNAERVAQDPEATVFSTEDIVKLSKLTMKKNMKKLTKKAGISEDMAFDILSVLPTEEVLNAHGRKHIYRYHIFFNTLYEIAKTKAVPFGKIMDALISEDNYLLFSMFSLLERKDKFTRLTESQKVLWSDISDWSINVLEGATKSEIKQFIKNYVESRKRDEQKGRDGLRRFQLSALSESDYPHIAAVISKMVADDENIKKYI